MNEELDGYTREVVRCAERSSHVRVTFMVAKYVAERSGKLYFVGTLATEVERLEPKLYSSRRHLLDQDEVEDDGLGHSSPSAYSVQSSHDGETFVCQGDFCGYDSDEEHRKEMHDHWKKSDAVAEEQKQLQRHMDEFREGKLDLDAELQGEGDATNDSDSDGDSMDDDDDDADADDDDNGVNDDIDSTGADGGAGRRRKEKKKKKKKKKSKSKSKRERSKSSKSKNKGEDVESSEIVTLSEATQVGAAQLRFD